MHEGATLVLSGDRALARVGEIMDAPSVRSEVRSRDRTRIIGLVVLVLLAAVVTVGVVLGVVRGPSSVDPGTPEAAVQAYAQAVLDGRWVEARALLASDLQPRCGIADLRNAWVEQPVTLHLEDVRVTDDHAEVEVRLRHVAMPDPFGVERASIEVFELTYEAGAWRITGEPWPVYACRWW